MQYIGAILFAGGACMENKSSVKKMTYQSNVLIESNRSWTATETKFFYMGLQRIKPRLSEDFTDYTKELSFTFTPKEIAEQFGRNWIRNEMDSITDGLLSKIFKIKNGDDWKKLVLFKEMEWNSKTGLKMIFNDRMYAYLVELTNKPYTKIAFENVFILSSVYAIRLLELMLEVQNKKKKTRTILYEDLRYYLGIDEKQYPRIENFKQRVLDKPLQEIATKTPYYISYEPIKINRKVVAFNFELTNKKYKIGSIEYDIDLEKQIEKAIKDLQAFERIELEPADKKKLKQDIEKRFSKQILQIAKARIKQNKQTALDL